VIALWRSTLGKKIVMAVTGLIMIGWVTGHLLGNLLIFAGPAKVNGYAAFLKSTGELLWLVRLLLVVASTVASRTIRWGGVLLLAFVIFHLLHMTFGTVHPSFIDRDVYHNLTTGLVVPWVAAFYIVSMIALGLHLYHGTWSGLRTLGLNRPTDNPLRRRAVTVFAVLLAAGFAAIPLAVLAGVVR
jgi:succinate dehydrogenase / fumarate reductase cytochrome b subunit